MILPIIAFGAEVLRKKCREIIKDDLKIDSLIENMYETMYAAQGVGLAAPQINKSFRLFIIDTNPFVDDENPDLVGCKKTFINPKIISAKGEIWSFNEGCLSIPEVREDVSRKSVIEIEYYDKDFKKHIETYDGLNARVILHEYDHIEGVLFTDKISPLRKRMIKGRLKDVSIGKFEPQYKMRITK